jgi:putative ABC transport system permease protein
MESITRIAFRDYTVSEGEKSFKETCIYVDENFFDMFSFPLTSAGNSNVLSDINSLLISERTANKLFQPLISIVKQ